MFELPTTVTVNNREYAIRRSGDFRIVLDCFEVLNDLELSKDERLIIALYIFYDEFEEIGDILKIEEPVLLELVNEMFSFISCGAENNASKVNYKAIDWKQDEQLICSAINKVAGLEVRAEKYIHWWTFMGYFSAIGESALSNIVSIRTKMVKGKKLEKYEREFVQDNPQYFKWDSRTEEQKEEDELLKKLWNGEEVL